MNSTFPDGKFPSAAFPDGEVPFDRVFEELRFALAQADASAPPPSLRGHVLRAAEVHRPAGRPVNEPPAIAPLEGYRQTVASFDSVLAELSDEEWSRRALRDLSIQELVGHLLGVERTFQACLGLESPADDGSDHVATTQPDADAQRGRPPEDTRRDWLARCARSLDHLAALDPVAMEQAISLHGFTLPINRMLIVRSFEMWTHEEDICRATGRTLHAPDASRLTLMTQLAVAALPRGLQLAGRPRPGRTARLVLTGPGGGTWQSALDNGVANAPDVRIVADATSFCRLVANRLDPSELHAIMTGDEGLGLDVLVGAMALALD